MLNNLIGICGKARHGKGEVAALLVEQGFREVQFSAPVKELALHIDPIIDSRQRERYRDNIQSGREDVARWTEYRRLSELIDEIGLDEAKALPEVRRLLQGLGNGAREIVHPDTWVNGFAHRYRDDLLLGTKLVVSDMRYPNEAALIRELGGEVWKVVRPDFDNGLGELNLNASETAVDDIHPNLTILNDGTLLELRTKMRRYLFSRAFE